MSKELSLVKIGERFADFQSHLGLSQNAIAQKVGVPPQSLSRLVHGVNVSLDILSKIKLAFPSLDIHWLMTGEGKLPEIETARKRILPKAGYDRLVQDQQELGDVPPTTPHSAIANRTQKVFGLITEALGYHLFYLTRLNEVRKNIIELHESRKKL